MPIFQNSARREHAFLQAVSLTGVVGKPPIMYGCAVIRNLQWSDRGGFSGDIIAANYAAGSHQRS